MTDLTRRANVAAPATSRVPAPSPRAVASKSADIKVAKNYLKSLWLDFRSLKNSLLQVLEVELNNGDALLCLCRKRTWKKLCGQVDAKNPVPCLIARQG